MHRTQSWNVNNAYNVNNSNVNNAFVQNDGAIPPVVGVNELSAPLRELANEVETTGATGTWERSGPKCLAGTAHGDVCGDVHGEVDRWRVG